MKSTERRRSYDFHSERDVGDARSKYKTRTQFIFEEPRMYIGEER
jgi:hypothetical protein